MKTKFTKSKILFLTNNFEITKPLYLWLKKTYKVILYDKPLNLEYLKKTTPDMIISYNYKFIVKPEIVKFYKIINLHISYLPFNRGAHPNIWSHIENTPSGVSIHYIDKGVDTGDIIIQKRLFLNKNLTLKQSYKKLHFHIQMLFKEWFLHKQNKKPKKQPKIGTFHKAKDLEKIKKCLKNFDITIKELKECTKNLH